jgi:hypothetical protein
MSLWAVVDCDRHTEPQVTLFKTEEAAVADALESFWEWSEDWKASDPDGWAEMNEDPENARMWTYSSEGDYLFVVELDEPEE